VLKQRVLTSLVLSALALAAVFLLPQTVFEIVLAGVFLYGSWEWGNLCRLGRPARLLYLAGHALLLALLAFVPGSQPAAIVLALLFWPTALLLVKGYPATAAYSRVEFRLLMGVLVLVPAWYAVCALRASENGLALLLMLLLLVWGADTGAYASGKTWGRHKLLPAVSPGKTLEGVAGGLVVCALVGLGYALWFELPPAVALRLVSLALLTGLVSVLGDLFESMLKRERGIKDSGQLLPGHGGVLDRIDSLTAAAPVFFAGLHLISGGW
jgi:phosphatidate cytidylyltransferase